MTSLPRVVCTTVLVETSPQAMPLGAACIASAIKADEKTCGIFSVELKDFSREDKDFIEAEKRGGDEAVARLIAEQIIRGDTAVKQGSVPIAVLFSVYVWNRRVLELASCALHELSSKIICIAGGPEATADPEHFFSFDYTIAGQGENAVPALLAELFCADSTGSIAKTNGHTDDCSVVAIPGVYCIKSISAAHSTLHAVTRAASCPPEKLVSPYLDGTLDPAKYGGALWELARGCPFQCSYCYESKGEKKIQYFPQERLEKELELFAAKKINQVFVLDPTYNADKKSAAAIIKDIAKKAPGMFFYFEARAELIDRELAKSFASIPCSLQIGLQSSNPDVLSKVHRTLDKKLFVRNVGFLNESGAVFGFDLIYGLPGDTLAGFKNSIDFALSLYPNNLELFCLSVLPGTTLHDDALEFGLAWEQEPPYHVLRTPTFSAEDIAHAAKLSRAVNIFYTQGRAIPWFNAIINPLHEKASVFLSDFESLILGNSNGKRSDNTQLNSIRLDSIQPDDFKETVYSDEDIINLQKHFVYQKYEQHHLNKLIPAAEDIITMNGAIGRCTADGTESTVELHYHPDDIMSEYSQDLLFFQKNAKMCPSIVTVFEGKNGVDWKTKNK
jgi:radical SAM superfamily enzyme YgiQ (UPF0313 family)